MGQINYVKVRFTSRRHGVTAGLVVTTDSARPRIDASNASRLFPLSEAPKMKTFQRSPPFATWQEAFDYTFEEPCRPST